jgi:heme exporter protein C
LNHKTEEEGVTAMTTPPRRVLHAGLGWSSLGLLLAGLFAALLLAPPDAVQGNVQRIMYVHVPAAWVAFLAFFVVFVGSVLYLVRGTPGWDRLAAASAEIGVLFTAQAIVAGAIWGKPTWGTWWTWDPRLTTTAILLLIYAGYLLLRSMASDARRAARQAAVLGIVGFVDIPITYMSVLWWRTLHQGPSIFRSGGPSMATSMLLILLFNVLAFTVLYGYLLVRRLDVQRLEVQALAGIRGG